MASGHDKPARLRRELFQRVGNAAITSFTVSDTLPFLCDKDRLWAGHELSVLRWHCFLQQILSRRDP